MARIDLSENEEVTVAAAKDGQSYFEKFKTQRSDWDDIWEISDYMVKAAQNRTLNASEKSRGFNPSWSDDERANTGSTLFFQQYRQLAAQLASVALSRDVPFKYSPISNTAVFMSTEDASEQAAQWNCLAKWTLKQDKFASKFISFAHQLRKYGNVPVLFYQNQKFGKTTVTESQSTFTPLPDGSVQEVEGEPIEREIEVILENWPSWRILTPDSVYADVWIGDLQHQDCVIVSSLMTRAQMLGEVANENWNAKQFELVTDAYKWDGSTNATLRKQKIENQNLTSPSTDATEMYMVWDVFQRCPIEGAKWDEESGVRDLYWYTVVGNDITDGIKVRFQENEDADNEIPIYMIHDMPDDDDILYHLSQAQIVRSNYSVECTIKNQMLDNNSAINHPSLKEIEGEVRGTDRKCGPNTVLTMDNANSLTEFDVKSLTQDNIALLENIKNDTKSALSTANNVLGEAYGGRTSALEAGNAYRNSVQPHMITIRYILEQFLGVYAKKMHSYWDKFAMPGQVFAITDEEQLRSIYPANMHGEFDIIIDIIDEYEDDVVQNQRLFDVINLAGGNPEIAKVVDFAELMTQYLRKAKMDYTKIIQRPMDFDAAEVARGENRAMIQGGIPATVKEGENLTIHLAEHEGERLRYNGVEDQYPNIILLDQHISETKFATQQGPQSSGSPPAPNGSQGAGEIAGNEIAGAEGGLQ